MNRGKLPRSYIENFRKGACARKEVALESNTSSDIDNSIIDRQN